MPRKAHNKLVRDRIPEVVALNGEKAHTRILSHRELQQALRTKLTEEAGEVLKAETQTDLINELADLDEVLRALREAHGVTTGEVEAARVQKFLERGGFEKGIFLEWTE